MHAGFALTKWYLDVVTDDGRVAIAYWAQVEWRQLRQSLCGLFMGPCGHGARPWRFSTRQVPPPRVAGDVMQWSANPLALTMEFARREPAFHHRLLEGPQGIIDWQCELPRAEVRFRAGDVVLEGLGYAERLDLTLLPWRIPADEIRWGRFLAADTSIVWIDWRGEHEQSLVFQDGRLMPVSSISEDAVRFGDGCKLALANARVLSTDVIGALLASLDSLRQLVKPIAHAHQIRWLAQGELQGAAPVAPRGWVVHELVRRR